VGTLGGLDDLGAGDAAAIRAFAGYRVGAPHLPDADPVGLERGGELLGLPTAVSVGAELGQASDHGLVPELAAWPAGS
jgi:hypothetical protein